jgi:hypothetical protein
VEVGRLLGEVEQDLTGSNAVQRRDGAGQPSGPLRLEGPRGPVEAALQRHESIVLAFGVEHGQPRSLCQDFRRERWQLVARREVDGAVRAGAHDATSSNFPTGVAAMRRHVVLSRTSIPRPGQAT